MLQMRYGVLIPLLLAFVNGCGSSSMTYSVRTYPAGIDGTTTYRLEGNVVTDSIMHDYYLRLEFNAQKTVTRDSVAAYSVMVGFLSSDWLAIKEGESLVLLVDGQRVGLTGEGSSHFRQAATNGAVSELAYYPVTHDQLVKIGGAREVRFKILGEDYDIERSLTPDNLMNLKRFAAEY